ncbi:sensor histidine kinase [Oscillochloris sp. ZM17-4]|uniref:sensor histidine kinase n=1 Tax=Oscillochloris sp. ZM17-4 TaxID=2866714 RepID=UPI001C73C608|nr:sensor histidine kinase [Oscillochloris sp. ZM17-4]MBX0327819.1 sensor histidine kinase [Oscillochloris sp. ZM17-4]
MIEEDSQANIAVFLPLIMALWMSYLLGLALVDHSFYPRPIFPPRYYLLHGLDALVGLGLVLWPQARAWLGRAYVPLLIAMMSVVPVFIAQMTTMQLPPGPASSPESVLLRTMPPLFMALVLTAWQYGWPAVIIYTVGVALCSLGPQLLFARPAAAGLPPSLAVVAIETISFLVVGYFISALIRQLRRQRQALAQANARLTDYAATLEDLTISRERNRMARELHDTLAHTLSALSIQLEAVGAYWEVDPAAAQRMLDTAIGATRSGLQETRRALKSLRASPLDNLGVSRALRQIADEAAARAGLRLELDLPDHLPALPAALEQCLYRVAQEATANVAHHADAQTLALRLSADNGAITLQIRDDGRGFIPERAAAAGHFGLAGMRERAQLLGGALTIISQPGRGTTVQLDIRDATDEGADLR